MTETVVHIQKRHAILYSDGSINVHPEGWLIEKSHAECEESNRGAAPKDYAKIALVTVVVDQIVFDPAMSPAPKVFCESCNQAREADWTYCPYCGAQSIKRAYAR
jgi:hypothetical protein